MRDNTRRGPKQSGLAELGQGICVANQAGGAQEETLFLVGDARNARDARTHRAGERPLEEPISRGEVVAGAGELGDANEAARALAEGEAVTEEPPYDAADGRVEQVLEQDILRVHAAHAAQFQHCEAGLHEEHEEARHEDPQAVDGVSERVDNQLLARRQRRGGGGVAHGCGRAEGHRGRGAHGLAGKFDTRAAGGAQEKKLRLR